MANQVFIPASALSSRDLATSMQICDSIISKNYSGGLMLVIRGGVKGVTADAQKQYQNLQKFSEKYGDSPLIVMLSNMPLEEIDFLHNASFSLNHVKAGIDFAAHAPLGKRKILTFHLNSLVSEKEFLSLTKEEWLQRFSREILPSLKKIAAYGKKQGVEVKVETTPVPEFGDISSADRRMYRDVKLNLLRNPFYLSHLRGFQEIRKTGLGICLDICHARTLYFSARSREIEGILYPEDAAVFSQRTVLDDVNVLQQSDIVHLNDGAGIYSKRKNSVFQEGIPLGKGDIAELPRIIIQLNSKSIPFVLEINDEGDFINRSGTKDSLGYLLKRI